ncbi:MAG TPA: hypothetical protein VN627_03070, partial [Novosphingobium sp.]|nr:hypothetical protein [Novosphingobium sp.]
MKSGLRAFGAIVWAAPVVAQPASDPLAPLPQGTQATAPVPPPAPVAIQPAPAPAIPALPAVPTVVVPRDWRGVFDAIDAGNWAAARAGIAALPPGILTPV